MLEPLHGVQLEANVRSALISSGCCAEAESTRSFAAGATNVPPRCAIVHNRQCWHLQTRR